MSATLARSPATGTPAWPASLPAVVAGAVGALYGPLHGGANEAVLRMLQASAALRPCRRAALHTLLAALPCLHAAALRHALSLALLPAP